MLFRSVPFFISIEGYVREREETSRLIGTESLLLINYNIITSCTPRDSNKVQTRVLNGREPNTRASHRGKVVLLICNVFM